MPRSYFRKVAARAKKKHLRPQYKFMMQYKSLLTYFPAVKPRRVNQIFEMKHIYVGSGECNSEINTISLTSTLETSRLEPSRCFWKRNERSMIAAACEKSLPNQFDNYGYEILMKNPRLDAKHYQTMCHFDFSEICEKHLASKMCQETLIHGETLVRDASPAPLMIAENFHALINGSNEAVFSPTRNYSTCDGETLLEVAHFAGKQLHMMMVSNFLNSLIIKNSHNICIRSHIKSIGFNRSVHSYPALIATANQALDLLENRFLNVEASEQMRNSVESLTDTSATSVSNSCNSTNAFELDCLALSDPKARKNELACSPKLYFISDFEESNAFDSFDYPLYRYLSPIPLEELSQERELQLDDLIVTAENTLGHRYCPISNSKNEFLSQKEHEIFQAFGKEDSDCCTASRKNICNEVCDSEYDAGGNQASRDGSQKFQTDQDYHENSLNAVLPHAQKAEFRRQIKRKPLFCKYRKLDGRFEVTKTEEVDATAAENVGRETTSLLRGQDFSSGRDRQRLSKKNSFFKTRSVFSVSCASWASMTSLATLHGGGSNEATGLFGKHAMARQHRAGLPADDEPSTNTGLDDAGRACSDDPAEAVEATELGDSTFGIIAEDKTRPSGKEQLGRGKDAECQTDAPCWVVRACCSPVNEDSPEAIIDCRRGSNGRGIGGSCETVPFEPDQLVPFGEAGPFRKSRARVGLSRKKKAKPLHPYLRHQLVDSFTPVVDFGRSIK